MDERFRHRPDARAVARDAALGRLSTLTRLIGVGAAGVVALLAGYVAQAKPGRHTGQHAGTVAAVPQPGPVPSLDTGGGNALAPPPEAPLPTAAPTAVVSGGS